MEIPLWITVEFASNIPSAIFLRSSSRNSLGTLTQTSGKYLNSKKKKKKYEKRQKELWNWYQGKIARVVFVEIAGEFRGEISEGIFKKKS